MAQFILRMGILISLLSSCKSLRPDSLTKDLIVSDSSGTPYLFFLVDSEDKSTELICRRKCTGEPNAVNYKKLCSDHNDQASYVEPNLLAPTQLAKYFKYIRDPHYIMTMNHPLDEGLSNELNVLFNGKNDSKSFDASLGDPKKVCEIKRSKHQPKVISLKLKSGWYFGDFHQGRAVVRVGKKWGYIKKSGDYLTGEEPEFGYAEDFSEGYAAVEINKKWGFIDTTGEFAESLAARFDYVRHFSEGLAPVRVGSKWGFVDTTGEFAENLGPRFDCAMSFSGGFAAVRIGKKWGFINKSGINLNNEKPKYDHVGNFSGGFAAVRLNGKWGFIDSSGNNLKGQKPKYDKVGYFSEGLAPVAMLGKKKEKNNMSNLKWGFIEESTGELAENLGLRFDYARSFSQGFASVVDDGWLFIHTSGQELKTEPQKFQGALSFSDDLAAVTTSEKDKNNTKWGFINNKGQFPGGLGLKYTYARGFSENLAAVQLGKDWHYINTQGTAVLTFKYKNIQ